MDNKNSRIPLAIYEGDEEPKIHWFISGKMWNATDVTNDTICWSTKT
jgi:hypothetical protein